MKKFTTFETQLGESVELTDKAKLSLYKKSQNSGYSVDILEEVYRRGYRCWTEAFGGTPDSFAFDRVNSFIADGFAAQLDEDLMEKRGLWDNIHAKRARIKAGSGERMRKPGSKGAPTEAAIKASQNEDADPCWDNYKQVGMKKKNGKKVPNCVPVKEQLNAPLPPIEKIADKFDKPVSTIKKVIKSGSKVEKEHTKDQKTAEKIATAHVNERPDYYKKLNKAGLEEQEEARSKDSNKPSSRFIGSDELVTIYKSQTPGQIIKKVVKETIDEATYKGKTVPLNKPMKGDVKKSKVFVDPDGDGKAKKVNFGDKSLSIKKHIPARKKSYCARSGGQGNLSDKSSANYWSRRAWNCEETNHGNNE